MMKETATDVWTSAIQLGRQVHVMEEVLGQAHRLSNPLHAPAAEKDSDDFLANTTYQEKRKRLKGALTSRKSCSPEAFNTSKFKTRFVPLLAATHRHQVLGCAWSTIPSRATAPRWFICSCNIRVARDGTGSACS